MSETEEFQKELDGKSAQEVLEWAIKKYSPNIALASSFGAEDVVLIDMIVKIDPSVRIFTLDTGRLPEETYQTLEAIRKKYNKEIEVYHPDTKAVEELITKKGPLSFYESIENRKECCRIRKIDPLKRVLSGLDAWITGLRREQAVTRADVKEIEDDTANELVKINPLVNWSEKDVWDYIKQNNLPYNKLHDQNYPSIGCAPCTRAVKEGEEVRAGRWWWENPETKECGLHVSKEMKC